jgi:hypothetical protein
MTKERANVPWKVAAGPKAFFSAACKAVPFVQSGPYENHGLSLVA